MSTRMKEGGPAFERTMTTDDTTDEVQQPDALLEQARAIVKDIQPGPLWDNIDRRMPFVSGYMCRYDDLKREFAIAIAHAVLAHAQLQKEAVHD